MKVEKFKIVKAEREAFKLKASLEGPSGGGKTYSSLVLARGLVGPKGKILMVDTEGGRGKWYVNEPEIGEYDYIELNPPFHPDRFGDALKQGIASKYDVVIFDSFSHEWSGEGGLLEMADLEKIKMSNNKRKSFSAWNVPKSAHSRFMSVVSRCPIHLIFCLREKAAIDIDVYDDIKKVKGKTFYVPICEKGFPSEMSVRIRVTDEGKPEYLKLPKFLKLTTSNLNVPKEISNELGTYWAEELAKGATVEDLEGERRMVTSNLEEVARDRGTEELREFWKSLPDNQKKLLSKEEVERIGALAKNTDTLNSDIIEEDQPH